MGLVYAEIELINAVDVANAQKHIIGQEEVRRSRVTMLVDSGAYMMCINETIQAQLDLPFIEKRTFRMADGRPTTCDVVGPVHVKFANRTAICSAFLLPGDSEPLLGALPMEEMDVIIHPQRQQMMVNPKHPDYAVLRMGGVRPL
jgi:clan AA aspartic protease